jgi:hypothetical protein
MAGADNRDFAMLKWGARIAAIPNANMLVLLSREK